MKIELGPERKLFWIGRRWKTSAIFRQIYGAQLPLRLKSHVLAENTSQRNHGKVWALAYSKSYSMTVTHTVYTVQYKEAAYVLHAFQKKSNRGIKTSQRDIDTVANRLRRAQQDYGQRYASKKKR